MNKRLILFILLFIGVSFIVNAQVKVQNLATPLTGTQNFVARDMVSLNPGFQYSGQTFTASIDETQVLPTDYLVTPVISSNRSFDYSAPVSTTQGAVNVSATGAANYQIPINIPAGIAGMEPNISIVYNSQGGSGLLGEGWDISGLSVITRVPRTIFSDGVNGAINFDTYDRYALDGNRLLALNGNYGSENSTYETEVKTFSKIQSFGKTKDGFETTTGPQYFIVTTKSGQVLEYGNTVDSRVIPHHFNNLNDTPIMWRINKITDPNGNYITFKYSNIPNSESVIERIEYTGNSSKVATSSIQFLYQEKKDNKTVFINDAYLYNRLLIRGINVINNGIVLRKYDFQYLTDNDRSYLNVITETGNNQTALNPTIIEWGAKNTNIKTTLFDINTTEYPDSDPLDRFWTSGDINNDGLSDLVSMHGTTINGNLCTKISTYMAQFGQNPISFTPGNVETLPGGFNTKWNHLIRKSEKINSDNSAPYFADMNGDGCKEMVFANVSTPPSGPWVIDFYSFANNTTDVQFFQYLQSSKEMPTISFGDFNNDGIDDLLYFEKVALTNGVYPGKICYFDKTGYNNWKDLPNIITSKPKSILVGDYNNDGLLDMMVVCSNGTIELENLGISKDNNGRPIASFRNFNPSGIGFNSSNDKILSGDFNGDGSIDFFYNEPSFNNWHLALKSANGYTTSFLENITGCVGYNVDNDDEDNCIITDFNNDGKSDVIIVNLEYLEEYDPETNTTLNSYDHTDVIWYSSNGIGFEKYKSIKFREFGHNIYDKILSGDFDGDGLTDIINYGFDLYSQQDNEIIIADEKFRLYNSFNTNYEGGLVKAISDGLNNKTTFGYKPITSTEKINNISFYTKGSASAYPIINIQAPLYCVSSLTVPNGLGSTTNTNYYYNAARVQLTGRGFLGFSTQTAINPNANKRIITSTELESDNCLLKKQTFEVKTNASTPVLLSKTENNYLNPKIGNSYFSFLASTVINDAVKGNTTTTTYDYSVDGNGNQDGNGIRSLDANGNVGKVSVNYDGGFTSTTKYLNYLPTTTNFINTPNKPQQIIVERKHPNDSNTFTESNTFYTYDQTKGNVTSEISNYGSTTGKQVTTNYLNYDQWGHPLTVTTTANSEGGTINISKSYVYDPTGLYVTSITDGLGKSSSTYDGIYGTLIKSTAVNGLETKYKYDAWGRLCETLFPDGNKSTSNITWANGTGPANALYYIKTENTGRPWTKTWYDNLGRKLREESVGYNGIVDYSDSKYNPKGQVERQTFFSNNTEMHSVTFFYNTDNDRIIKETYSNGKIVEYSYSGSSVTTKVNGIEKTTDYDQWGNVKKVIEPIPGETIDYTYWSNGKPKTIVSNGVTTSMTYDEIGNQKTLTDPDAGTIEYRYDALGRLTYQKDAIPNVTTFFYDNLGRLDYKKNGSGVIITDYEYFTEGKGIGEIKKITAKNGSWDSFEYDELGRQYKTTRHIDATYKDLVFQNRYDAYGNVDKITYPDNYIVDQQFDQYGNLVKVLNGSTEIWALNILSATSLKYTLGNGQVTEKTYDNNGLLSTIKTSKGALEAQNLKYEYDPVKGLLMSREDLRTAYKLKESFTYDNLDRLQTWEVKKDINVISSNELNYKKDKINGKSDVGNYFYNNSIHPHAVSSVISSGIAPINLNLGYNEFGKVSSISSSSTYGTLVLEYGPDDERTKTVYTVMGAVKSTNYYNGLYEAKQNVGEYLKEYYYIMGGDGIAAVNVRSYGSNTLYYVHKDHLGSITCITKSTGAIPGDIEEQMNYDPWGQRRNPSDWSINLVTTPRVLSRGFTGHEHLDNFKLINMNGRIYDPALGLFISCDNYVQNPMSTQSLNRYSYCFGNPLSYTDPDGNNPFLAMLIYGAITQGAMMGTQTFSAGGDFWEGALKGASISIGSSLITAAMPLLPISNFAGEIGNAFLKGGTAFAITGLSSEILNGKWDMKNALISGTSAFVLSLSSDLSKRIAFKAACAKANAINPNGKIDYNSEVVKRIWKYYFGDTKGLKDIYTNGEGTNSTISYNMESGNYSNGVTIGDGFTSTIDQSRESYVYLSKNAFQSKWRLYNVMGHERVHVMDYFSGRWDPTSELSTNKSEIRAYHWMFIEGIKFRPPGSEFHGNYMYRNWFNEYMRLINL